MEDEEISCFLTFERNVFQRQLAQSIYLGEHHEQKETSDIIKQKWMPEWKRQFYIFYFLFCNSRAFFGLSKYLAENSKVDILVNYQKY